MTEHLPECPWAPHDCDEDLCERCDRGCYCNELRACEERAWKIAYVAYGQGLGAGSDEHRQHEIGWIKGYDAALDAARKAVADLRGCIGTDGSGDGTVWVEKFDALSAIDALRKEKQ